MEAASESSSSVLPPRVVSLAVRAGALFGVLLLASCEERTGHFSPFGGNAKRGRELIKDYACGACHTISRIQGANGVVGPPLTHFARRAYIVGNYPNQPTTVVRWIQDPPAMAPDTAMPNMGVSERDAKDIAAFLFEQR